MVPIVQLFILKCLLIILLANKFIILTKGIITWNNPIQLQDKVNTSPGICACLFPKYSFWLSFPILIPKHFNFYLFRFRRSKRTMWFITNENRVIFGYFPWGLLLLHLERKYAYIDMWFVSKNTIMPFIPKYKNWQLFLQSGVVKPSFVIWRQMHKSIEKAIIPL